MTQSNEQDTALTREPSSNDEAVQNLINRLKAARKPSNALDMEVEIALFVPDDQYMSVRPNHAGTKLIYTGRNGYEHTFLAWDWTLFRLTREQAIERLAALAAPPPQAA